MFKSTLFRRNKQTPQYFGFKKYTRPPVRLIVHLRWKYETPPQYETTFCLLNRPLFGCVLTGISLIIEPLKPSGLLALLLFVELIPNDGRLLIIFRRERFFQLVFQTGFAIHIRHSGHTLRAQVAKYGLD